MVSFTRLAITALAALTARTATVESLAQITDIKIVGVDTGTTDILGVLDATFAEVTINVSEVSSCWFTIPEDTFNYTQDTPYQWKYGHLNLIGKNNISIDITEVPQNGQTKLSLCLYFNLFIQQTKQEPDDASVTFQSSSGDITAKYKLNDLPTDEVTVRSGISNNMMDFKISVPVSLIQGSISVQTESTDGREFLPQPCMREAFENEILGDYGNPFCTNAYPAIFEDNSGEKKVDMKYHGKPGSGTGWIEFIFPALAHELREFYTQEINVSIGEVTRLITCFTYPENYTAIIQPPEYKIYNIENNSSGERVTSTTRSESKVSVSAYSSSTTSPNDPSESIDISPILMSSNSISSSSVSGSYSQSASTSLYNAVESTSTQDLNITTLSSSPATTSVIADDDASSSVASSSSIAGAAVVKGSACIALGVIAFLSKCVFRCLGLFKNMHLI